MPTGVSQKRSAASLAMQRATERTSVTDQLFPAGGFREGDRLTAVDIVALGDALSVAEGIADGFRD
jgi:hypothetical protein